MQLIEAISRGGFGRVEKVQLADGSFVARKTFDPEPAVIASTDVEKLLKRFRREVRVQSSLPNPFFIPVIESSLDCENPWFTMPLAERNFSTQIDRDRAANVITTEGIADILNALEALHALGFAHRDLKPENVLLHDGTWKLSDFGLVTSASDETKHITGSNSAWGSKSYCAPEQVGNFHGVTCQADIYSFGCILHDLVDGSGRIPFQKYTADGALGQVIEKCTEVDPQRRFRSVSNVRGVVLTILTKPTEGIARSPEAEEWVEKLKDVPNWSADDVQVFSKFVRTESDPDSCWQLFRLLDEKRLKSLHEIDPDQWQSIAEAYSKWAQSSFDHRYCDVVIRRLEIINSLGSLDSKARAILAAVRLGTKHNSWFVMDSVVRMCGPKIEERLAQRLAIEIIAEQLVVEFRRCVHSLGRQISDYHELVEQALLDKNEYQE